MSKRWMEQNAFVLMIINFAVGHAKKVQERKQKKAEPKCRYQKQKQNHDEMRAINAAFQKKRKEGKTTERKMPESRSHIVHV